MSRTAVISAAALIISMSLVSCSESSDPAIEPFTAVEGKLLPDLRMRTLEGETISLSSFQGKPLLINFWASWCKPCREEFPLLSKTIRSEGVHVIGVVFEDTAARAAAFKKRMGAEWPMVEDPSGVIAKGFRVTRPPGIPQTVFIDPKGRYHTKILGQINEALLDKTLSELDPSDEAPSGM